MARRGSGRAWAWIGMAIVSFLMESIADGQSFIPVMDQKDAAVEAAILKALDKPVTWNFDSTPLSEVAYVVGASIGVTVILDEKALEDAGVGSDTTVTYHERNLPAGPALELLLRRLDLNSVPNSGVLLITTPDKAAGLMRVRVYPVADLIHYVAVSGGVQKGGGYRGDFQSLMNIITSTIKPESWDDLGGPGAIQPFRGTDVLVISQTIDVHLQIQQLLDALRRSRGVHPRVVSNTSPRKVPVAKSRPGKQVPTQSQRHVVATAQPAWRMPYRHEYEGQPQRASANASTPNIDGAPAKTSQPARQAAGLF